MVHIKAPEDFSILGQGTAACRRWHRERDAGTSARAGIPPATPLGGGALPSAPTLTESQEHLVLLPLQVELVNSQEGFKLLLGYMGKDVLRRGRMVW